MSDNVIDLGFSKKFNDEQELMNRLVSVISEFDERISLVAALGVIELLKSNLIDKAKKNVAS